MFPKFKKNNKSVYLDYAATTPLDKQVQKTMAPFWSDEFGNPSSLYRQGREARKAVESARQSIARLINASPSEIIFTAGGTESVNLAIFGSMKIVKGAPLGQPSHIIVSAIEHPAILSSVQALQNQGAEVTLAEVDNHGFVNVQKLFQAVNLQTGIISIMYANNEIGSIQPIGEIGRRLSQVNKERERQGFSRILFHTDACQAAGALDLNVNKLGVDLMTVNGSKIYGPKQTGFLYVRTGTKLNPLIFGGGQERGLRSGTENVPGIVGLAEAFRLAQKNRAKENGRLAKLRDYFIREILKQIPNVSVNGPEPMLLKGAKSKTGTLSRLPNNINLSFSGIEGESLLLYLDSYGISVSTGSACSSANMEPSHVLQAIGRSQAEIFGSIRLTLGKFTVKKDLDYVLKVLPPVVAELRKITKDV
ncbi:MAG: cysteine desulfurase [Patescibacteria group bacterium]|nr:cysteine desulfurase [Patescibacteria group bacterium]